MNKYGISHTKIVESKSPIEAAMWDDLIERVIDAYLEQNPPGTPEGVPDPYAELKKAAADPTKQIRCGGSLWFDAGSRSWTWCEPPEKYEIRDKPKPMKKVKMLAYANDMAMFWRTEDFPTITGWKRVPSEDKEVEIEE
jgi:hypothetical protein